MGIIGSVAAQAAAEAAAREKLKKGKTIEQQHAIDFLYRAGASGCFGKRSPLNMQSYIDMVQRKCQALNLQEKAMAKIGLDPSQVQEIPPIVLNSFVYDDDCLIRVDNNVAVSSQYSITWIFFSATQLYTYKYIFDTTCDDTWEITKDFFYTDVTCFSTERAVKQKIDIDQKGCLGSETITKNLYVVDTLELIVPGAKYTFSLRNSATIEQSIQAAKAMIREKKYMK